MRLQHRSVAMSPNGLPLREETWRLGLPKPMSLSSMNFLRPWFIKVRSRPTAARSMIDPFSDEITVWSSTQAPFSVRQQVADVLGVSESLVRCIGTPVGGGFGGKGVLYDTLIALAARIVNRPIRFILSRYEEMVAANATPPGEMTIKLGAKNDGTFTAIDATYAFNSGCYPSAPLGVSLLILGSMYKVPQRLYRRSRCGLIPALFGGLPRAWCSSVHLLPRERSGRDGQQAQRGFARTAQEERRPTW